VLFKLILDQEEVVKNYDQRITKGAMEIENTCYLQNSKEYFKVAEFER
jgi:hypothetical protein